MGLSGGSGFGVNRKDLLKETRRSVSQSWDCSQVEDDLEEGAGMDWYEDDEMLRPWEEVGKEGEKLTSKRNEGRHIKAGGAHYALDLMVLQAQMKKKEAKNEKANQNVVGRSTERMDEKKT